MFCYKCLAEALEEEQRRHEELEVAKKSHVTVPSAAASVASPSPSPSNNDAKKQKSDS